MASLGDHGLASLADHQLASLADPALAPLGDHEMASLDRSRIGSNEAITDKLVAGHHRLRALKQLGTTT
jgi:hypothetical protein